MGFSALDYSVSIIAYEKKKVKYGMSCAWCMQVDYDKMVCLLGAQSDTGKHIEVGDLIGISIMSKNQKDIALHFGENHSSTLDKFKGIEVEQKGSIILIPNSARMMQCEVIDVLHLKEIEEDQLIYVRIKKGIECGNDFLHYGEL
ncbi:MAG: flavin reductase family protein [Roseburia sp.]|nr:flavin reductase family protein [Anaeroplasma bactoclasticum]MCM1197063.1 flavin reductase family protein [Roseburia sp.]MCM1557538.1 flavin reductase family protein [Anaeroplasma bactoclasticum]